MLLALLGGAFGTLLAAWGTKAALKVLPEALPRANEIQLDARVLLFTLGASVFAGLLFGLVPAFKSARSDIQGTLREGGRGHSGARHRTQSAFVGVEVALAVVLLVAAGLVVGLWWGSGYVVAYTDDSYVDSDVVQVTPEVAGSIEAVHVSDNQWIKRGSILFTIDPRPFKLELQQAIAACFIPGLNRGMRPMCRPKRRYGPSVDGTKEAKQPNASTDVDPRR